MLEPETGSDSAVSSNGPNLLKANAKVMLAVVTGGAKNTTLSNRQAVVDTWFGLESYMVTAEDVGAARVIRLPKEAERGGRSALPKKVKHMWAHLYEHFLDEYDWFMKLDDDTFVHKERLLKTLSVFDPTVPLLLGKSYVTRPSSGAVTGPGAMWKDVDSLTFCHGGAGYIMSRELLRRVGPHLLESTTVTALEDAAIAAACFEVTGARCMNTNLRHFGGIDMVRNSHDQGHILSTVKALELDNRVKLALTATVHSVEAEMTRYLYQMYRRMDADTALSETADRLASRDLEKYRSALVASFNCTLSTPVGAAEPRFVAVCMRSALRWKPRTAPREPPNLATAWALVEGAGRSCQVAPPVRDIGWLAWNADIATPPRAPSPRPTAAAQGPLSANGVMIAVSSAAEVTYLALLLSSLRATGSSAWVAVFFDEARFAALLPALRSATVADCACRLIAWRSDRLRDAFDALSWKTHPSLRHQGYAVMGSYLRSLANKHGHVLMTRPDSFFQRDPFKAMPLRQGLNFFSLDPLRELPLETCFPTKTPPRLTEKLSATFPDTVFGSTSQLTQFLGALLYRKAAPGCSFDDNLSMAVWRKVFASGQPVNVLDPHTSPVVGVFPARGRYRVHDNVALVTNHAGTPAALVSGYAARTLVDGLGQLAVLHPGGAETPLQAALQRHAQLAAGIRLVADYRPLSATQWPAGDKAFSRFQSLGVGQSPSGAGGSEAPEEPFLAVWEALWRSSRFARDPARATVTKVAVPKTHKTGSSTLASVFFRYAARHKLRVWQRGTWTFVPAATFVKPPPPEDKEQYDMHISHLNPRGFFRGPFSKVADFYQHVIGPDVNMVTLVREPRQQYVSWLYYYVVPKMKEGDPMDVLRQFVADGKNKNILSQEFALRDRPTFDTFMKTYFEQFKLIMIAERFDESLVLLRRLFNWGEALLPCAPTRCLALSAPLCCRALPHRAQVGLRPCVAAISLLVPFPPPLPSQTSSTSRTCASWTATPRRGASATTESPSSPLPR